MELKIEKVLEEILHTEPRQYWEPAFDPTLEQFKGIRAMTYEGLTTEKGKTLAFAYIGFPENATGPVPGVVLVHGGGGHAFLHWVKQWNDRGYAAIAMDNTACFPTDVNAGISELNRGPAFEYGLKPPFAKEGYVDAVGFDNMEHPELPLTEQWMTHALAQVVAAHNVLRAFPQVDDSRIGICGISWGGIITSMVITHDPRFAFAVPIYGSGYLDQSLSYMGPIFQNPDNAKHFRAEDRFGKVHMPVLWLAWNDDCCFSVNSNSLSYLATCGANDKTCLSMVQGMGHSHTNGWEAMESLAYADWIVGKGAPMVMFQTQPDMTKACAELSIPEAAQNVQGKLYWLDEPYEYDMLMRYDWQTKPLSFMKKPWQTASATISNGQIAAELPAGVKSYYLEVTYTLAGEPLTATSAYIVMD